MLTPVISPQKYSAAWQALNIFTKKPIASLYVTTQISTFSKLPTLSAQAKKGKRKKREGGRVNSQCLVHTIRLLPILRTSTFHFRRGLGLIFRCHKWSASFAKFDLGSRKKGMHKGRRSYELYSLKPRPHQHLCHST